MVKPDESTEESKKPSARRLLRPADLPENFTRSLYKIAPYRGCAHGCRYCDGRAERYYVEGDFEKDLVIRYDIPYRLEMELPTVRERGMIAFGSGVTDPYQAMEGSCRITGACARLLAEARKALPALVMTKSSLALRDLSLWDKVNQRSGLVLLVSLTSLDEELRECMEPGASSFAARLEMIRSFKKAGCRVGVLAMPLLPGLSDSEESIHALYSACAELGVDFVMPGGLTLRPGRQKDFYLAALRSKRPGALQLTESLYREDRPSGAAIAQATRELNARIAPIRREYAMPFLLPHRSFASILPPHDSLRLLFRDMLELYSERDIDTLLLAKSAAAYDSWLVGLRRNFRRRRSLPDDWIEERFAEASADGELERLLANARLAQFAKAVLEDGARLDYLTLKLN